LGGKTVLVIEDDPDTQDAICGLLEYSGYRAVGVNNGREALDFLKTHSAPQVIVLDLMMPVMNGWEFRDFQREDETLARIPVVVISASGTPHNVVLGTGAVDYVPKPFDPDRLVAAIERITPIE
jgi:Response regulator containing CheY-like receiver, AAA-type ATPase, and DNA-binding domains